MSRPITRLSINDDDRHELERRVKARHETGQQDMLRARIVLMRAEGNKEDVVAKTLGPAKTRSVCGHAAIFRGESRA